MKGKCQSAKKPAVHSGDLPARYTGATVVQSLWEQPLNIWLELRSIPSHGTHSNTAWVLKNLRLASPGTWGKTKHWYLKKKNIAITWLVMTFCYTCRSVPCFTIREGKRDPKPNIMQRVRDLGTLSISGTSPPNPSLQDITFFPYRSFVYILWLSFFWVFTEFLCLWMCVFLHLYVFLVQFLWLFFLPVCFFIFWFAWFWFLLFYFITIP